MTGEPVGGPVGADLPPVFSLVAFDVCGSTNDEAKALAAAGAPEGTVVWARRQERGRGRRGRSWDSPAGNLYCTFLLRPGKSTGETALFSFAAALAVAEGLEALGLDDVRVKWPNDVLLRGRKVAGILLESDVAAADTVPWVVVGIGVNIAHHPAEAAFPATSLREEGWSGAPDPVRTVLAAIAVALERCYARFRADGFAPIRQAWLARAAGIGGQVTVRLAAESFTGTWHDLDVAGGLLVDTAAGLRRVTAGDVFFG